MIKQCCTINYKKIMILVISVFRTKERKEINGLIKEFKIDMKFEKILRICSVFAFGCWWLLRMF